MLEARGLTVRYGNHTVLDDVGFTLKEGQWLMVVGPNGAGKSTLISALSQGIPYGGSVTLDGLNAKGMQPGMLARKMGVLAQRHAVGYSFTVEEVARLGRYAYATGLIPSSHKDDTEMVEYALKRTGMLNMRHQSVLTLSGGELQRVFLAQLWAQNPKILLLDEPSNHLDLVYQKQTFELIRQWLDEPGRAVLSVVHDLSLAKAYGTEALMLNRGRTVGYGSVQEVLTRDALRSVYDMDVYDWMNTLLGQWR